MTARMKLALAVTAALGSAQAAAIDPYVAPTDPYLKPDGSWISISGTVVAPTTDSFTLDYGKGTVMVEMDDWDNVGDAFGLLGGDKVTVYGAIDDDLFEVTTIEAGAVYVENLNTYFYANSDDEEDAPIVPYVWYSAAPIEDNLVTVRGTVTEVDADEKEFTINSGSLGLSVDAGELGYNPFDDLGFQKIEVGDVVSVTGDMGYEFIDGRELDAVSVVTLHDARQGDS